MKRFAQFVVLTGLVALAGSTTVGASERYCRDVCIWSMGYCGGEGGMWVQNCDRTGQYYEESTDTCDLDAYCWYGAPEY